MSMVLWIGVDDTDSLRGMCTTFLATEVLRELPAGYDLIGYPRLVRLNPNIPWKTRGNGAVCIRVGHGLGQPFTVGVIDNQAVRAFPASRGGEDPAPLRITMERLLEQWACFEDPNTNPAFVILGRPGPPGLYWQAVREVVPQSLALRAARARGLVALYKNGRGVIGSTAAVSWRPRDRTYEVLAYRERGRWGTPRALESASVIRMDRAFPRTFNNYDYDNQKVVIAPHSPCPVLLGIRGDSPVELPEALSLIAGERPARWVVFETNQGTDDHVVWDDWTLRPRTATSVEGTVSVRPVTNRGGHVFFQVSGPADVAVAAYEPSKQFRETVRQLLPGDRVRVVGSVREDSWTLNLEKLEVIDLVPGQVKARNPACPLCGKSMKSAGSGAGYRCAKRHARMSAADVLHPEAPRALRPGWYEPPASARRHLSKPLKRMPGPHTLSRAGYAAHGEDSGATARLRLPSLDPTNRRTASPRL